MDSRLKLFADHVPAVVKEVCTECNGEGVDNEGDNCISCDGSGERSYLI